MLELIEKLKLHKENLERLEAQLTRLDYFGTTFHKQWMCCYSQAFKHLLLRGYEELESAYQRLKTINVGGPNAEAEAIAYLQTVDANLAHLYEYISEQLAPMLRELRAEEHSGQDLTEPEVEVDSTYFFQNRSSFQ